MLYVVRNIKTYRTDNCFKERLEDIRKLSGKRASLMEKVVSAKALGQGHAWGGERHQGGVSKDKTSTKRRG